jgi:hypothetical protein
MALNGGPRGQDRIEGEGLEITDSTHGETKKWLPRQRHQRHAHPARPTNHSAKKSAPAAWRPHQTRRTRQGAGRLLPANPEIREGRQPGQRGPPVADRSCPRRERVVFPDRRAGRQQGRPRAANANDRPGQSANVPGAIRARSKHAFSIRAAGRERQRHQCRVTLSKASIS